MRSRRDPNFLILFMFFTLLTRRDCSGLCKFPPPPPHVPRRTAATLLFDRVDEHGEAHVILTHLYLCARHCDARCICVSVASSTTLLLCIPCYTSHSPSLLPEFCTAATYLHSSERSLRADHGVISHVQSRFLLVLLPAYTCSEIETLAER